MSALIIAALTLLDGAATGSSAMPPVPVSLAAPTASDPANREAAPSIVAVSPAPPPQPASTESPRPKSAAVSGAGHDAGQDDIVVTARTHATPGDPMEMVNVKSFAATQAFDRALIGPAALAYQHSVPEPVRSGVRNVLDNLHEPDVFLNFLVQLKPGKAAETLARFVINSTIGGAGLFDVAKRRPFKLPHRHNGFADSLGYYGVKPGPFMFLPLIGPTTLRDLIGGSLDRFVLPVAVGSPFNKLTFSIPVGVVSALDHRAEFDEQLHILHDDTANPYAASRDFYLRRRQAEIDGLHGKRHAAATPDPTPAPVPAAAPEPPQKSPAPD